MGGSSIICPGAELARMQHRADQVLCSMAIGYSGRGGGRGRASRLVAPPHPTSPWCTIREACVACFSLRPVRKLLYAGVACEPACGWGEEGPAGSGTRRWCARFGQWDCDPAAAARWPILSERCFYVDVYETCELWWRGLEPEAGRKVHADEAWHEHIQED